MSQRMRKVNELLREVIAAEVTRLTDPRIGFVTITGVDTSPDLRNAKVFYSVLGDDDAKAETQDALDHATRKIQAEVGRQVRLKYTPKLAFHVDDAVERGLRLHQLLHQLEEEDHPE